jgi:hypothetical protein
VPLNIINNITLAPFLGGVNEEEDYINGVSLNDRE